MCEESERSYAVVEGYKHDVLVGPLAAFELRLGTPSFAETATKDPESDRKLLAGFARILGIDVEVETVLAVCLLLAVAPLVGISTRIMCALESRMAELVANLDTFPWLYRLWSLPAEVSDRRCCIRDSLVDVYAFDISGNALNLSTLDGEDWIVRLFGRASSHDCECAKNE